MDEWPKMSSDWETGTRKKKAVTPMITIPASAIVPRRTTFCNSLRGTYVCT